MVVLNLMLQTQGVVLAFATLILRYGGGGGLVTTSSGLVMGAPTRGMTTTSVVSGGF
jgi:hypothetical protein